jgi:tetratricopeptide (TPR) repeat protein
MKLFMRITASIAVVAAAVAGTYRLCYLRHRCNLQGAVAERSLTKFFDNADQVSARIAAREIDVEMDRCAGCWRTNVNFYMARAAALRILGRRDEAAMSYRSALRYDRRAELYLNLGLTELDAGQTEKAADALTTAVLLQYYYLETIPEPMQTRIRQTVDPTYEKIRRKEGAQDVAKQLRERVTRDPA